MINFTQNVNTEVVNYLFNNNIVEFTSSTITTPTKATIKVTYGSGLTDNATVTIYPSPSGVFWYNLTEILMSIPQVSLGYIDTLNPDTEADGFFYSWERSAPLITLEIKVFNAVPETDTYTAQIAYVNGLVQVEDYRRRYPLEIPKGGYIMPQTPFVDRVNRIAYIKAWRGYPIDLTLFLGALDPVGNIRIENLDTTQVVEVENTYGSACRWVISDGQTDTNYETEMVFSNGINRLHIGDSEAEEPFLVYVDFDNAPCMGGLYIKWINSIGGYSYWYFHKQQKERNSKEGEAMSNDFNNLDDTISATIWNARELEDSYKTQVLGLNEMQKDLLADMIESPSVFMFTGIPFDTNTSKDWIGVSLKGGNFKLSDPKRRMFNFDFQFGNPNIIARRL